MSGDADEVSGMPEDEMNGLVEAMPPVENDVEVTVWSAESDDASDEAILGQPSDEILQSSVEAWIDDIGMTSTKEVPVPDRLVDQVIGQEAGSVIIRKAAEQRRHMLMIGDPGTGKSMLARSMTELLPRDALEDVLVYPNEEDENEPRVRSVPAGRGDRIVKVQKEAIRVQREKTQRMLLIGFVAIAFLL
ncbi:MAG: ATP-binding protein, partial [Candidatus Thermoplasmatota archaeon]|nr:ATP-binding protein [Candidatus Thermoplasmatota archaeon]